MPLKAKKNIYLTGFMAAGKTTVGRLLAQKLGWDFQDTDEWIQKYCGMPMLKIFKKKGEAFFRGLETLCLKTLKTKTQTVVSLGGGLIINPFNRALLMQEKWIFLHTPLVLLKKRLENSATRPLAKKTSLELENLYRSRWPYYQLAPLKIYCDFFTPDVIVKKILEGLTDC